MAGEHDKSKAELIALAHRLQEELEASHRTIASLQHPTRERQFQLMAESSIYGVWLCDPDGAMRYASQSFLDLLGLTMEQAAGLGWMSRVPPEDIEQLRAHWLRCVQTGEQWDSEFRILAADEQYRTLLVRGEPARDEAGNITCWAGINLDITARKLAEEAITDARDLAEAKIVAKDRFLAMLSHELRTPLTPAVMAVAALEMDPNVPQSVRDDMAIIRRNLDMEVRLIDDLLDLNRFTSGKIALRIAPTNVHDELHHAFEACRSEAQRKQLHVEWKLEANRCWVAGDAARLRQVFWNLLRNATKFTPEGGRIAIHSCNDTQGNIQVQIRDSGIGIHAASIARIFTPFEQGEERIGQRFGGMGLGLAISKAIVDLHLGRITAHSEGEGRGATFTVELPATAPPSGTPGAPQQVITPLHAHLRFLLVEDHMDTARVMTRLLQSDGYTVVHAPTGAAALKLASEQRFDLLISDLGLPDMTGLELMRQLKAQYGMIGIAIS
ncbi:MAG: ATP-binding protein, partial [Bacillota bacterium]